MTQANLINWVGYWDRASQGPTLGAVSTQAEMTECRRYNPCMSKGLMYDVSDIAMFAALVEYREMLA